MILEGRKIRLKYKLTDEVMINNIFRARHHTLSNQGVINKYVIFNNSLYISYKIALIKDLIKGPKQSLPKKKEKNKGYN